MEWKKEREEFFKGRGDENRSSLSEKFTAVTWRKEVCVQRSILESNVGQFGKNFQAEKEKFESTWRG